MGSFVFFGAIRGIDESTALADLKDFCGSRGYKIAEEKPDRHESWICTYGPLKSWVRFTFQWQVIDWKDFFIDESRARQTITCYALIFEDDYWQYWIYKSGQLIASFCSKPQELSAEMLATQDWTGNPREVARVLKVDESTIRPYLTNADASDLPIKVVESDGACLDDPWVMTDFLDKLGIHYPNEEEIDAGDAKYLVSS